VQNAETAGAIGVIIYMADSASPIPPAGVDLFYGNVLMISNSDGLALKDYLKMNPTSSITADLAGAEMDVTAYSQSVSLNPALGPNQLASYSSQGPARGTYAIKPDLVATGGMEVDLVGPVGGPRGAGLPVALERFLAVQNCDPKDGV